MIASNIMKFRPQEIYPSHHEGSWRSSKHGNISITHGIPNLVSLPPGHRVPFKTHPAPGNERTLMGHKLITAESCLGKSAETTKRHLICLAPPRDFLNPGWWSAHIDEIYMIAGQMHLKKWKTNPTASRSSMRVLWFGGVCIKDTKT